MAVCQMVKHLKTLWKPDGDGMVVDSSRQQVDSNKQRPSNDNSGLTKQARTLGDDGDQSAPHLFFHF